MCVRDRVVIVVIRSLQAWHAYHSIIRSLRQPLQAMIPVRIHLREPSSRKFACLRRKLNLSASDCRLQQEL